MSRCALSRVVEALQVRALARSAICAAIFVWNPVAHADQTVVLPIQVHVVHVDGRAVVPPEFVDRQFASANAIFAAYGVGFAHVAEPVALAAEHAALETRADRDALGAYVRRGAIHCFVVRSLRDVDDPSRMRRGVHWRSRTHAGAHYVVLSSIAGADVLAHELGHFLGNPSHSETPGNLMSYARGAVPPFLDARQQRRMRAAIRVYRRRGELRIDASAR
jgi:hypothetical protein